MKQFRHLSAGSALLLLLACVVYPLESAAQNVANGYICDVRNPGSNDARRGYRERDGIAVNITSDFSFTLSCPIIVEAGEPFYEVVVRVGNGNNATQKFTCVLEEFDLAHSKVRSIVATDDVPAGVTQGLAFTNVELTSPTNYLSMWCGVPPGGHIGLIAWQ